MKGKLLCIILVVLVAQAHVTQAGLLGSLLGVVGTLTSSVLNLLNGILATAQNLLSGALTNVNQLLTGGVNTLTGLGIGITTAAGTTLTGVLAAVDTHLSKATGTVTGIVNNVAQNSDSILATIPAALTNSTLLKGVQQSIVNLSSTIDGSGFVDALVELPVQLLSSVSQVVGGVSSTLADALSSLPALLNIINPVNSLLNLVRGILGTLPTTNEIAAILGNIQNVVSALPADILNKMKTEVAAGKSLATITAPITATLNVILNDLYAKAGTLVTSLGLAIKGLENSAGAIDSIVTGTINKLVPPLFAHLTQCPTKAAEATAALNANAKALTRSCITAQTATLTTLVNQLNGGITTLKSNPLNLNVGALSTLATAITNSATIIAQVPITLVACLSNLATTMVKDGAPVVTSLTC